MTMATVEAMRLEVERRMRRGERFTDVEDGHQRQRPVDR